jgi:hypothetical protein
VTRRSHRLKIAATVPGNRNYTNSLHIANYFRLTPDNRMLFGGRAKFSAVSNQKTDTSSGERLAPADGRHVPAACRRRDRLLLGRPRRLHAGSLSSRRQRPMV